MPKVVRSSRYRFILRPRTPAPVLTPVDLPDRLLDDNGVIRIDDLFIEEPHDHTSYLFPLRYITFTPRSRAQRAKDQRHRRTDRRRSAEIKMSSEAAKTLIDMFKVVPKLEIKNGESNFVTWSDYVILAAGSADADKYLIRDLAANADATEKSKHAMLLRQILFKLPIEVFSRFSKTQTCKALWSGLRSTYAVASETTKAVSAQQFYQLQLKDKHKLVKHLNDLDRMYNRLREIGSDITPSQRLEVLIGSIPDKFDTYRTAITSIQAVTDAMNRVNGLTPSDTGYKVLDYDTVAHALRLAAQAQKDTSSSSNRQEAHYSSSHGRDRGKGKRGRGGRGHGGGRSGGDRKGKSKSKDEDDSFTCFKCGGRGVACHDWLSR